MPDTEITRLRIRPKDADIPAPGEGLRPIGLTAKAIRHRLIAERQAKYAEKVLPFQPKGTK